MINQKPKYLHLSYLCCFLLTIKNPTIQNSQVNYAYETADKEATLNTKKLFNFLKSIKNSNTIIGHHDDLAYGHGWRYKVHNPENFVSDIYNTCGDFPGVFGWDLGQIESKVKNPSINYMINGILIEDAKNWAKEVHQNGGINYYSWHVNNPVTGGTSWDNGDGTVVCKVLQEGSRANIEFKQYLNIVADFFLSLKDKNNVPIPVMFRPFHEVNMTNCFWWNVFDEANCSHNNFKILWQFVFNYLTKVKKVHNLLYVLSLNDNCIGYHKHEATMNIENEYPGDDFVDIIGFDLYMKNDFLKNNTIKSLVDHATTHNQFVNSFAQVHNKLSAITEAGWENYPAMPRPFTQIFEETFNSFNYSFILFWRNPDRVKDFTSYYSIYPKHPNAEDFRLFYNSTARYIFLSSLVKKRKEFDRYYR
jgi:beta-mannanase